MKQTISRILVAYVAGLVTTLVLAFLFHRAIMGPHFDTAYGALGLEVSRARPFVAVAYALFVAAMVYLYPQAKRHGSVIWSGYRFGAAVGFIFIVPVAGLLAAAGVALWLVLVDAAYHVLIEHAIPGVVIALILARSGVPEESAHVGDGG